MPKQSATHDPHTNAIVHESPLFTREEEQRELGLIAKGRHDLFVTAVERRPVLQPLSCYLDTVLSGSGQWQYLLESRTHEKRQVVYPTMRDKLQGVRPLIQDRFVVSKARDAAEGLFPLPWHFEKFYFWTQSTLEQAPERRKIQPLRDELFQQWRDIQARRNYFAEHNLRLVGKRASALHLPGFQIEDEVNEGVLGLLRGIIGFDPAFGTRFSTYAQRWIDQAIRAYHRDTSISVIRIPAYLYSLIGELNRAESDFFQKWGRVATKEELQQWMGIKPRAYANVVTARVKFLDLFESGQRLVIDDAPDRDETTSSSPDPHLLIGRLKQLLSDEEFELICQRFGLGEAEGQTQTLKIVGENAGITREAIRQRQTKLLRRLKWDEELQQMFEALHP
jgi:RNA polymerase primary sigma factor